MPDDPKNDEIVYHYCALDTFVKIVTGKKLWLSNVFCMNDYEEHRWFRRLVRAVAKEMVDSGEVSQDELRKGLLRGDSILDIEEERYGDGVNTRKQVYCISFSKVSDSLSQWRAYGDSGQGVAIGFRRDYLETAAQNWSPGDTQLVDVLYDDQSQRDMARQVVLGGMLIPYFEIPIKPEEQPIRKVICGPTNYFLQNQRFIKDVLQEHNYGTGVEVTQSKASYRTA